MGQRNRAALDKARAEGAKTWLSEEFNCAGDGVMRRAWRQVSVPELDDGDWKQKFTASDGTTFYDQDAVREGSAHFAKAESEHSAAVRALPPVARRAYATYLRTGRLPEVRARAPREARNDHQRGSRRGERSTSSSSDDPGPDSEPPSRRLCAFCGKNIPADRSPKATHCSDRHADRDRQRRKRQRDRARSKLPPTPTTADFWRMLEISAEDRERLRELVVCRCNGHHLEFEPGWCSKCGHWLPDVVTGGAKLYAAFMARLVREEVAS